MRFVDPDQEQRWRGPLLSEMDARRRGEEVKRDQAVDAATDWHMLAGWWSGALDHYNATGNHNTQDADQLPEFTLETIDQLTEIMRLDLGVMIQRALGMQRADNRRLVAMWIDDVAMTSWRLLIDRRRLV